MSARLVTGLHGEHLVEVTVVVDPDPAWHGRNWHWTEVEDKVKSAVAREQGLELVDAEEVRGG